MLAGDAPVDDGDWPSSILSSDAKDWGEDDESSYSYAYFPTYVYSYEQVSYDFNHSFDLEELFESYSYELVDPFELGESFDFSFSHSFSHSYSYGMEIYAPEPNDVFSVTSMDVSADVFFVCLP